MTIFTPSQTVGPFFSIGLIWEQGAFAVPEGMPGAFWIRGTVYDGAGDPVVDAVVETWQADPDGGFGDGFGRAGTDEQGDWAIHTRKPGTVSGAPHVDVSVFARGLLARVVTRIYFPDEDNAADPVLAALPSDAARETLIAAADGEGGYRFDIHLQGERETVFFAL